MSLANRVFPPDDAEAFADGLLQCIRDELMSHYAELARWELRVIDAESACKALDKESCEHRDHAAALNALVSECVAAMGGGVALSLPLAIRKMREREDAARANLTDMQKQRDQALDKLGDMTRRYTVAENDLLKVSRQRDELIEQRDAALTRCTDLAVQLEASKHDYSASEEQRLWFHNRAIDLKLKLDGIRSVLDAKPSNGNLPGTGEKNDEPCELPPNVTDPLAHFAMIDAVVPPSERQPIPRIPRISNGRHWFDCPGGHTDDTPCTSPAKPVTTKETTK